MKIRVTRDVLKGEEHNFLGRNVSAGEIFYRFKGSTYGCVDAFEGVALSEYGPTSHPFFEFPRDAMEDLQP